MTVATAAGRWSRPRCLPLLPGVAAAGGSVSAPSTRVSAIRASPSLEDALVAYPEQEEGANEHDSRDDHRERGGLVAVVVVERQAVDPHQRHPFLRDRVGER